MRETIDSLPIPAGLLREAFEHFGATGELPESQRLAQAVVRRATLGFAAEDSGSLMDSAAVLRAQLHAPIRPKDEVMDSLYNEAVWGGEIVRLAARHALALLSHMGFDVTEPVFAKYGISIDLPDWGSVGLHLLGFQELLKSPPYTEQAKRLLDRFALLRQRGDGSERWLEELVSAIGLFRAHGELPDDDLVRECVLADGELTCLLRRHLGAPDPELLAAFDAVAGAAGAERGPALAYVQKLVRQGRLLPLGDDSP